MGGKYSISLDVTEQEAREKCERIISSFKEFRIIPTNPYACDIYIKESNDKTGQLYKDVSKVLEINRGLEIFIISEDASTPRILELMHCGVRAYITAPVSEEKLRGSLEKFLMRRAPLESEEQRDCLGVSLLGVKGGVGVTTLAVNLSCALQRAKELAPVLLMDLQQPYGDAHVLLNMAPTHDLGRLVRESERLDATLFMNVLETHPSGLRLMPPIKKFEDIPLATPEVMTAILGIACQNFNAIVFDLGSNLSPVKLEYLFASDFVLLICQQDVSCLRNLQVLHRFLTEFDPALGNKIRIVVNRFDKRANMDLDVMQKALDLEIYWTIPSDFKLCSACSQTGKTIMEEAPASEIARSLAAFASSLCADCSLDAGGRSKSIAMVFQRIFGR